MVLESKAGKKVVPKLLSALERCKFLAGRFAEFCKTKWGKIKTGAKGLFNGGKNFFKKIIEKIKKWFKKIKDKLKGGSKAKRIFDYADGQLDDIPSSVWNNGPVTRGDMIDNAQALKNNLGHNFPTVDFLYNRVLSSTKSYDITSKTYSDASKWLSKLKADINKLNKFTNKTWNGKVINETMYDGKCLNIVLPNHALTDTQKVALEQAKDYASALNINIKVYITK